MLADYLNKKSISEMSFEDFKKLLKDHHNIAIRVFRDGHTASSAFKELGGVSKSGKKKPTFKKSKVNSKVEKTTLKDTGDSFKSLD